ncbi:MAG: metallophosphoesterase family protein [Bacteroidales bacterium]
MKKAAFFLILLLMRLHCHAQGKVFFEQYPHPQYNLPGNASEDHLTNKRSHVYKVLPEVRIEDMVPTSVRHITFDDTVPSEADFYMELIVLDHVNRDVGFLVSPGYVSSGNDHYLGYYGKQMVTGSDRGVLDFIPLHQFESYWTHLCLQFRNSGLTIFCNGKPVETLQPVTGAFSGLNIVEYFNEEPYMELGNLLKYISVIEPRDMPDPVELFEKRKDQVLSGSFIWNEKFFFVSRPYLHCSTDSSVAISFETNVSSKAELCYGKQAGSPECRSFPEDRIHTHRLTGLDAGTKYYYRVKATNREGEEIETSVSTFVTSGEHPGSIRFAIIGDTESRPFINNQIACKIWGERPDFVVILGDLTDGGKENAKYQWLYEYFSGIGALAGRVPVFPAAGNGEGDLYWFNRYHDYGDEAGGYYSFTKGDADFFVLHSDVPEELGKNGKQYRWLEEGLNNSASKWKFLAMHHAPWSSDENDYGNSWTSDHHWGDTVLREITALAEEHKVDIVFSGHLHVYERSYPMLSGNISLAGGTIYIVSGGAGGNPEDFAPERAWFNAKAFRGYHYMIVNLLENTMRLDVYDLQGNLIDYLQLKK